MHGLPKNFETGFLQGKTLELVCFAQYQVWLHLSGACLIGVEGELAVDNSEQLRLPDSLSALRPDREGSGSFFWRRVRYPSTELGRRA